LGTEEVLWFPSWRSLLLKYHLAYHTDPSAVYHFLPGSDQLFHFLSAGAHWGEVGWYNGQPAWVQILSVSPDLLCNLVEVTSALCASFCKMSWWYQSPSWGKELWPSLQVWHLGSMLAFVNKHCHCAHIYPKKLEFLCTPFLVYVCGRL
jgi:hypothetical protein